MSFQIKMMAQIEEQTKEKSGPKVIGIETRQIRQKSQGSNLAFSIPSRNRNEPKHLRITSSEAALKKRDSVPRVSIGPEPKIFKTQSISSIEKPLKTKNNLYEPPSFNPNPENYENNFK